MFESRLEEARHVTFWHMFSDKTTDVKGSGMSLEEAEHIVYQNEQHGIEGMPAE
ncbi:hypothetical protein AB4254_12265 [Vibrio breoganii]